MRWNEINEAPLADFGTYGDLNTPGSFPQNDLKAMNNDKWVKKLHVAFEKTRFNFNLYLYNAPEGIVKLNGEEHKAKTQYGNYHGLIHPLQLNPIIGKLLTRNITEQAITVLLTQNEGDEIVPLTPWIVAHRVAHAIFYADRSPKDTVPEITRYINSVRGDVDSFFVPAARLVAPITANSPLSERQRLNILARQVGKFRSAREGNVRDRGEFAIELVTQFIVQGKVTLNRPTLSQPGETTEPSKMLTASRAFAEKYGRIATPRAFAERVTKINDYTRPTDQIIFKEPNGIVVSGFKAFGDEKSEMDSERVRDAIQRLRAKGHPDIQAFFRKATKREINAYEKRLSQYEEAIESYQEFMDNEMLGRPENKTEAMTMLVDTFEKEINSDLGALFSRCVGKVFVL
jgi:hypothetical protein